MLQRVTEPGLVDTGRITEWCRRSSDVSRQDPVLSLAEGRPAVDTGLRGIP
ncbi:hypothetical protein ACWD5R_08100 [Streptomyces sp. NPDC002514]|uniref:hypothetical protein n=1 Tax=Streptomyces sp. NPDC001270 TaxID=3364554 RepID=UPI003675924C